MTRTVLRLGATVIPRPRIICLFHQCRTSTLRRMRSTTSASCFEHTIAWAAAAAMYLWMFCDGLRGQRAKAYKSGTASSPACSACISCRSRSCTARRSIARPSTTIGSTTRQHRLRRQASHPRRRRRRVIHLRRTIPPATRGIRPSPRRPSHRHRLYRHRPPRHRRPLLCRRRQWTPLRRRHLRHRPRRNRHRFRRTTPPVTHGTRQSPRRRRRSRRHHCRRRHRHLHSLHCRLPQTIRGLNSCRG